MPKQILVADDSVTMHKVFEITFAGGDYALITARNGDEAIARAREIKPDVVLADAVMPGKSGYDVCAAIKADPQLSQIPCVILTGNSSPYDEVRGQKAGADGFVQKPFDTQALVDKVSQLMASGAKPAVRQAPGTIPFQTMAAPPAQAPAPAPSFQGVEIETVEPLSAPLSASKSVPIVIEEEESVPIQTEAPQFAAPSHTEPRVRAPSPVPLAPPPAAPPPAAPPPAMSASPAAKTIITSAPSAPMHTPPPAPLPTAPPRPAPAPSRMHTPVPAPLPTAAPTPAPMAAVSKPSSGVAAATMPLEVPKMPRPSLIPHVAAPTPGIRQPKATIMGMPAVNAQMAHAATQMMPAVTPPPSVGPAMRSIVSQVTEKATAEISSRGPEYGAIASLSREVIEKIAWEVVPELAETIIKHELDRLVRERKS